LFLLNVGRKKRKIEYECEAVEVESITQKNLVSPDDDEEEAQ